MNKQQILIVVIGVLMIIGIYQLPRVVVENEVSAEVESHDFSMSPDDAEAMGSLRQKLANEDSENYLNFADSLGRYYLKYGFLDSAVNVASRSLKRDSSLINLLKVSDIYYTAFERSGGSDNTMNFGSLARTSLSKILEEQPDNLSVKTKLAMTLVVTQNPMSGITLLREVVNVDPNYREAILNLGLLSIQSGQYDRGIERFEKLLELDPEDDEAMIYLAICLRETGDQERANELLTVVAENENADPALRSAATEYLKEN